MLLKSLKLILLPIYYRQAIETLFLSIYTHSKLVVHLLFLLMLIYKHLPHINPYTDVLFNFLI